MSEKIATREAYGKALVELGAANDKIVVLDADLAGATMTSISGRLSRPFFDCGIAECNMMDIGAGLSTMGLIPSAPPSPCSVRAGPTSRSATHCLPQVQCKDLLFPRRRFRG